jgi:hypothetical protein
MENGCKRLTRRDTEHVCWQRVPACGMTRKTHQGTEQARGKWAFFPGGIFLRCQNYPIGVLNRLVGNGFLILICLIYICLYE